MKAGDRVRLVRVPAGLRDDGDLLTRTLFDLCIGRIFSIAAVESGLVELEVGAVVSEAPHMHSI